jgi:sulfur carrier protein ThiS
MHGYVRKLEYGRLGDRPLYEVVGVPATTTVTEALRRVGIHPSGERWLIVLDGDGVPLSAVRPDALADTPADTTLGSVVPRLPPVVTVAVGIRIADLLASGLLDEFEPGSAVIATNGDGVVGVWAGPDLMATVAAGTPRSHWDAELPGEITIPLLTRTCRYTESDTGCTGVLRFPERPGRPPACPNPASLTAHAFVW